LGFPCVHLYSHPTERVSGYKVALGNLKGKDADVAAAARGAGLWVSVVPYLIEDSGDEKWQLARFPSGKDADLLRRQVVPSDIEKILTVTAHSDPWEGDSDFGVTWVIPPPDFGGPFKPALGGKEKDDPALALFRTAENSATSYFGNEACDVAFYVYAALHVAIPPLGEGPRQAATGARKARPRVR
jgi:hypothetical protein